MILIDSRVGSRQYADFLGDKAILTQLDSGDVAFAGNNGTVGIEIKKVRDAVQCLFDGRLADYQIPKMRDQYDLCYLIVEGTCRTEPRTGVLQYWKEFPSTKDTVCGRWLDASSGRHRLTFSSFSQWLTTLESVGGVMVRSSPDEYSTTELLLSLYMWHQKEEHKSFRVMQEPRGEVAELTRPNMMRRILALLPGVGWTRSGILAPRFQNVRAMVEAPPEKWYIEGQIAKHNAERIQRAINGDQSE